MLELTLTDKMTEYNGQTITYDRIGNPLTYRDGMTMTWKRGRQLTTLQTEENSIQYKYDSDSIRTSKIVDGVVHTYEYLNGLLMHETRGAQAYDYYYDANGQLYAVSYKLSEDDTKKVYYFTHNWRGDIVGIYNGNGELKATYSYDAWGNVTAIEDANGNAITEATDIANLNPFRYRGYYMDTETGLYYLLSRYYDPVTHRFLNADGYFQSGDTLLDTNMNAYCRNNPISYVDYSGCFVFSITNSVGIGAMWATYSAWGIAIDDKGNIAFQISSAGSNIQNPYFGACYFADLSRTVSVIWNAESVYSLEKKATTNFGASFGDVFSLGGDIIFLEDGEHPISGVSVSGGAGAGIDFHTYQASTTTVASYNIWSGELRVPGKVIQTREEKKKTPNKQTNKSKTKTNTKATFCRYCGKPIGTESWQCSGGWM